MPGRILVRADASTRIGTGHLMRCLALAQGWREQGGEATFLLRAGAPSIEARLQSEGLAVRRLAAGAAGPEDAAETASVARELEVAWVVVDGYSFDSDFQETLKKDGQKVLWVDDYGHTGNYPADIILDQNIDSDPDLYSRRAAGSKLLIGTRYVLLRREFWPLQTWRRENPERARRLLVTLGAGDHGAVTGKVISGIGLLDDPDLETTVVVGGENPHREAIEEAGRSSGRAIRAASDVRDMSDLMTRSDICVSAGGTTCWELSFLGLPSLIIEVADNQRRLARGLEKAGAASSLGWHESCSAKDIARGLEALIHDAAGREKMSRVGRELVDGDGVSRVVRAMRGD